MPRQKTGIVTSTKNDKTITVTVNTYKSHPKYGKRYLVSSKFLVHDEKGEAIEGDTVLISETKPISKSKSWKFEKIVKKGIQVEDFQDNDINQD